MPRITFIGSDEAETVVDARSGTTLMEAGLYNGVAGIDADCGGACSCATCQVVIDPAWRDLAGPANGDEIDMLSESPVPPEGLRLSCQIVLADRFDGMIVRVPAIER